MVASHRTAERVGLGDTVRIMGNLERLNRYHNNLESSNSYEVKEKLDSIKQEMVRDWNSYKQSRTVLSDEEVQDNKLDMLIVYLIKRGFFDG